MDAGTGFEHPAVTLKSYASQPIYRNKVRIGESSQEIRAGW